MTQEEAWRFANYLADAWSSHDLTTLAAIRGILSVPSTENHI
jgi:hypothetical protein